MRYFVPDLTMVSNIPYEYSGLSSNLKKRSDESQIIRFEITTTKTTLIAL